MMIMVLRNHIFAETVLNSPLWAVGWYGFAPEESSCVFVVSQSPLA